MAARAIWKGNIRFGKVEVPVKLYSAVTDRTVHFRLLDAKKKAPVKQRMVDPDSEEPVPDEEVKRAFLTDDGELVILEAEELEELEPEDSRDIRVEQFLPSGAVSHLWYDRPYYLGPDGNETAYAALTRALRSEEREGIARWVMRKKEYAGVIRPAGEYLMLMILRHAGEVIPASALKPPAGRDLSASEVNMAKQLVAAMEDDELDLAAYKDEYRERLVEYLEAKAAGKVVKFPRAPRKPKEESLAAALEKSLASTGRRKRANA